VTPEEWFAASIPEPLLATVRGLDHPPPVVTRRRFRLFGCAAARQVWDLLPTDARSAVQASERFADERALAIDLRAAAIRQNFGQVTISQLALAAAQAASALEGMAPPEAWGPGRLLLLHAHAGHYAARAIATRTAGPAPPGRPTTREWHDAWNAAFATARATQAGHVRDIFPPPGYSPHLEADWLTSTVVAIARQMDESGDFSPTPILADALQDAGCDDEVALQCCRVPGNVHVRGNWVVDLVLDRQ